MKYRMKKIIYPAFFGLSLVLFAFYGLNANAYDRKQYGSWKDLNKDGFNTRHELLYENSIITPVVVERSNGKKYVVSGRWITEYTKLEITNPKDIHIDHRLAVKELDSACGYKLTKQQKQAFYNDEDNLVISYSKENIRKGAKDETEYLPPRADVLEYQVKRKMIINKHCD